MYNINIQITGLEEFKRFANKLPAAIDEAADDGAKAAAGLLMGDLKKNYRSGSFVDPPRPVTLAKRRIGKLPGKTPAVPTYSSMLPLVRSGALLRAIKMWQLGKGRYIVGIPEGVKSPQGHDLNKILSGLELGVASYTIPMTVRMQRYLHVLYRSMRGETSSGMSRRFGGGGNDSTALDAVVGSVTVGATTPRPIWDRTLRASKDRAYAVAEKTFMRTIRRILL